MKKSMIETPIQEIGDPSSIADLAAILAGSGALVAGGFAIEKLMSALKSGKAGEIGKKLADNLEKAGTATGASVKGGQSKGQYEQVASELNEAKKTIKQLTSSLQEVNLLNAKLLFVNKVLKENKHLSDAQVANVIATFDKATTAKEAKLVYESFATTLVRKSNAPVVESKLKGLASKSVGVAPAKVEVITEVSDAVKRMQKLAGIIK
jgi:predicted  nucleic acid-binding Zn-ribbon protein